MTTAPGKLMIRRGVAIACALLLPFASALAQAQSGNYPEPNVEQAPPQLLAPAQLDNLVAPIALYPDPLLSEVLAASTYPLEVVEAGQWLQQNRNLRGPQLIEAAKQQNWDPSVQALAAFPDVLAQLNRDVQWTTDLGNAFLAQQADVMDAVQRLRAQARDNGRLETTPQQTVTTQAQDGQSAIAIQPADPQVMYVPQYNPAYIWGPPAYGAYPPLGYPPVDSGFGFGLASFVGTLFGGLMTWGGWGWGLSWLTHALFLNNLFFSHFGFHGFGGGGFGGTSVWAHSPVHRLGVPYPNHMVAARYNAGGYRYNGGYGASSRYSGGNLNARLNAPRSEGTAGWRGFGESRSVGESNGRSFGPQSSYGSRSFEQGNRMAENSYRGGSSIYGGGQYRGGPSASYRAPAQGSLGQGSGQGYRAFSGSATRSATRSATQGMAPSYRNSSLSRSFAPSSNSSAPRASSQHFSAPRSSGGGHSGGGHSGGGHSGGGHSGGGHSGGGRKR